VSTQSSGSPDGDRGNIAVRNRADILLRDYKIGGLDGCWPPRWRHEFSTKLASTRRGSTHSSTQKLPRLLKPNHNVMASASSALFRQTATDC